MVARSDFAESSPDVLGGTPVFRGARVPLRALWDYLDGGQRLDEFLDDYPTVQSEQAHQALQFARHSDRRGGWGLGRRPCPRFKPARYG